MGRRLRKPWRKATPRNDRSTGTISNSWTGRDPAARLGRLNYFVEGVMIGGFAIVAWPADYRVTGVQTFIVSYDGIVYQKDLGPSTSKIASTMELYNPDKTWHSTSDDW